MNEDNNLDFNNQDQSDLREKLQQQASAGKEYVKDKAKEKGKEYIKEAYKNSINAGAKTATQGATTTATTTAGASGAAAGTAGASGAAAAGTAGTTGAAAAGAAGASGAAAAGTAGASGAAAAGGTAATGIGSIIGAYILPVVLGILAIAFFYGMFVGIMVMPSTVATTIKKFFNSGIESILNMFRSDSEKFEANETRNIYLTADYLRGQGYNLYTEGYIFSKAPKMATLNSPKVDSSGNEIEPDPEDKDFYVKDPSKLTTSDRYVETEGIYVSKGNKVRYLEFKNSPLFYYTWINGYSYFIDAKNREYSNWFQKIFHGAGNILTDFGRWIVGYDETKDFSGLIVPMGVENASLWDKFFKGDPAININLDDYTMRIVSNSFLFIDEKVGITYNLVGWSGRYGLPINFITALHRATNAPDLIIEMIKATNDETKSKTKLYMDMNSVETNIGLEYKGQAIDENFESDDEELLKAIDTIKTSLHMNTWFGFVKNDTIKSETIQVKLREVKDHWFRDVYFKTEDGKEYIEYDADYLIKTGELWAKQNDKGDLVTSKTDAGWSVYTNPNGEDDSKKVTFKKQKVTASTFSKVNDKLSNALKKVGNDLDMVIGFVGLANQYEDARRGITNPKIKELLKKKWYIYDGTVETANKINKDREEKQASGINIVDDQDNPLKKQIDFNIGFSQALAIIRQSRDIDAEYVFKDLKELLVEMKYFKKEDLRGGIRKVLAWPLKKTATPASWPSGKESQEVNEYGIKLLSKNAIKALYLAEAYSEEESRVEAIKLKAKRLEEQYLDEKDEKKLKEIKTKIEELNKKLEEEYANKETKRAEILKKYEELNSVTLEDTEENRNLTAEQRERKIEKEQEKKKKTDYTYQKLESRYGKGYDEKEYIVAPATGKISYEGDTVKIKVLDEDDIKNGNLPEGYKEFYETEYKGVISGNTIEITNVEKYNDPREISTNKTGYKNQITKSEIKKLSTKEEQEKVEKSEELKKEAPAIYGDYVKEGTIIAKPNQTALAESPATTQSTADAIKELSDTELKNVITITMTDVDESIIDRLPEYIVKGNKKGFRVEIQENYDTRAGGEYDDRTDPENVLDPDDPDSVEIFRELFKGASSGGETIMEKYPEAFLDMQRETGVNAIFAGAVSLIENGGGTNLQIGGNNFFSIRNGGDGWKTYSSPEESIMEFGKLISQSEYYHKAGKFMVNDIGPVYAPPSENTPNHWEDSVNQFITDALNRYEGNTTSTTKKSSSNSSGSSAEPRALSASKELYKPKTEEATENGAAQASSSSQTSTSGQASTATGGGSVVLPNGNTAGEIGLEAARRMSAQTGVPVETWEYIIARESNGNPNAQNPSGASGLFQTMPFWGSTATVEDQINTALKAYNEAAKVFGNGLQPWGL